MPFHLRTSSNVAVLITPDSQKMEYSQVFDVVKFEKEKAVARFNLFRRIARLRQILEASVVLCLISWSSARAPAAAKTAADSAVRLSAYLLNHHVVFLIGNAIIVLLFVLCRRNDAVSCCSDCGSDLYDDYVKHREAANPAPPPPPQTAADGEKQIVVREEEAAPTPQGDDVAEAIEKATRQIKRFQRTQSEKLRREIGAGRPQAELRRSESQNRWSSEADMERLSNEEFRQTVDAFIDKHWSKKERFEQEYEKYQLLKMA